MTTPRVTPEALSELLRLRNRLSDEGEWYVDTVGDFARAAHALVPALIEQLEAERAKNALLSASLKSQDAELERQSARVEALQKDLAESQES